MTAHLIVSLQKLRHTKLLFPAPSGVHTGFLKHIFCSPQRRTADIERDIFRCVKSVSAHLFLHTLTPSKNHTCSKTHTYIYSPDEQTAAVLVAFLLGCDGGVTFSNLLLFIFFTVQLFSSRVSLDAKGSEGVTEVHSSPLSSSPTSLAVVIEGD